MRNHDAGSSLGYKEHSGQIDVDNPTPYRLFKLNRWRIANDARIVHHNVKPTGQLNCCPAASCYIIRIRHRTFNGFDSIECSILTLKIIDRNSSTILRDVIRSLTGTVQQYSAMSLDH